MLDAKHTEVRSVNLIDLLLKILLQDKVLLYVDEQVCSRLTGTAKKNCKEIIETNGKDLINSIKCGTVRIKRYGNVWIKVHLLEINASVYSFPRLYRSSYC